MNYISGISITSFQAMSFTTCSSAEHYNYIHICIIYNIATIIFSQVTQYQFMQEIVPHIYVGNLNIYKYCVCSKQHVVDCVLSKSAVDEKFSGPDAEEPLYQLPLLGNLC